MSEPYIIDEYDSMDAKEFKRLRNQIADLSQCLTALQAADGLAEACDEWFAAMNDVVSAPSFAEDDKARVRLRGAKSAAQAALAAYHKVRAQP